MRRARLGGWRLATIRGVELKLHFSPLLLLLYVLVMATAQFPLVLRQSGVDPAAIGGTPLLWGAVFSGSLLLSVILHEFAHVIVAQSMGVRVEGITLMMLGGMSEMERIPEEPYAEFKVSIVGPLASFAIAAVLLLVRETTTSADLSFFSYWLARVNLALGVFNLLPAFPLDGGRALRSLLAARSGMVAATHSAVRVARVFAWALGVLGLLSFNFLLMLIAIFVYSAANSELVIAVSRGMLKDVSAWEVVDRVDPIRDSVTLRAAADAMIATRHRILPVLRSDGTAAILTAELLSRVPRDRWAMIPVDQVAMRVSRFLDLDGRLDEPLPELAASGALPVKDGPAIVGVVAYADIAEMLELKRLAGDRRGDWGRAA